MSAAVSVVVLAAGLVLSSGVALTATAAPATPRCASESLAMSVGQSDGTAGTVYYPLVFTNVTKQSCTVEGTPAVRASTGINSMGGLFLGRPALVVNKGVARYGDQITLRPGQRASAAFGVVDTGNFTPATCVAKNASSVSVSFMGRLYWGALRFSVCTKRASTTISGVVRGATGVAA